MKGQPCILESPIWLKANKDYFSLCGRWIENAFFTASWDQESMGLFVFIEPEKLCPKCREKFAAILTAPPPGKRYVYGAVPGSEVKQQFMED